MRFRFRKTQLVIAVAAAISVPSMGREVDPPAAPKARGTYAAGDFHNHTTCSDGSISMQKLVSKATDKSDATFGLDWFVQAGHGGSGNRNCTLVEDATLATPAYPLAFNSSGTIQGPTTTWQNSTPPVQPKGAVSGSAPNQNMWRWQSIQEFQYPLLEYLAKVKDVPLFIGVETVVPGHEHTSASIVTGQMPAALDTSALPAGPGYTALGDATSLAQWEYCFDRNDTDVSRGNTVVGGTVGNNWDCSVDGSANAADPNWNATARKLLPASGTGTGNRGHAKSVEGVKWMGQKHTLASYYVPAHLERAGPFSPNGNNGFNIEHLRDFNNAAPTVAFGFETQPGHGASSERGEYFPARNSINGTLVDSVGGTTYGGTGVYGAQVGGVWDALLGEGRNWWFFASSDWHNRGVFGPDDRRSSQDFLPGEYQRNYTMVRNGDGKLRPQSIVDGLRTGNGFAASGQLIDRLAFVACAGRNEAAAQALAIQAALDNTEVDSPNCVSMGGKLTVRPGTDIAVAIVARDPDATNYSPYSFDNPSLLQVGIRQPINAPVLDHVDVIRGLVSGYRQPGAADYAGQWPNTWLANPDMATVPAAAKNTSAAVMRSFNAASWKTVVGNPEYKAMSFRIPAVVASQYVRLRGTNMPASVPFETDADGNPLTDVHTNATTTTGQSIGTLKIACTATGQNVPANGVRYTGGAPIDGCPNHLPSIAGVKYVAYDIAAWSDLWFYSNPIYVEVTGSTVVAGVR
jgi:hypothetical protein